MIKRLTGLIRGDGYQARALRGSFATIVKFGGHNALRLASNLILTRLLFPEAFGLMALVQVVLAGTAMFSDIGINGSIVQNKRGDDPAFLNTAWTVQIARGVFLGLCVALMAQPLASFYEEPLLGEILLLAAITPAIQGFNSTRIATANRKIALGRLTMLALGSQAFGIVVTILLAWWMQSVWALAIGNLFGVSAQMILSHIILPGTLKNRLYFEWAAARELFGFGKFVFLATLASFFTQHGDRAILGKFITLEELAIYNIGFFLASIPLKFARGLNDSVIFPLYARRPPKESARNRRRINRARFFLTFGLLMGATLLALFGDAMVRFMYDFRYEGGGPILVLIAIALLPQLITLSYERLPMSAGRSDLHAFLVISKSLLVLGLTLVGVMFFGVFGVILAPLTAWILTYPILIYVVRPFGGWDPKHDAIYFLLSLALMATLLTIQWDTIAPLMPEF